MLPLTCLSWDAVVMCPFDMARPSRKSCPSVSGCLRRYRHRLEDAGEHEKAARVDDEWGDLSGEVETAEADSGAESAAAAAAGGHHSDMD